MDDHCRGIRLALEKGQPGRVCHIDGDTELANMELTQALLASCGAGWDSAEYVEGRKGHDRRYSLDDSLLRSMGYAPKVPFPEGLKETVRWYEENPFLVEPLRSAKRTS